MMIYEEVFRRFQKERIDYMIVGGIATNLLGALRATADLDIVIDTTRENMTRVDTVMKALGYRLKQPIDIKKLDERALKGLMKTKHLKAISYHNINEPMKEVDIVVDSPVSFERAKKRMVKMTVGGLNLPVISIDDLIRMKVKAARSVDKYDVAELRKIKKMRAR
ncbi:MAG: hypothetical protein WC779_06505 [Candidatus Omnitrophota bacterium]|jgi:hypothetical protein